MSEIKVKFFSQAICRFTSFNLCLPNDLPPMMTAGNPHYQRPMKTLFLLHGYSGDCNDWLVGSSVSELAGKYNLAVVMPQGDNSFYVNGKGSDKKYEDFICADLVNFVRNTFGIAKTPEDTLIGGLSMGGFGAIRSCLAHPEVFGKMFGLSSALITDSLKSIDRDSAFDGIADYDYYETVFGDLKAIDKSPKNPWYLVEQYKKAGKSIPPLYMACGSEDFLVERNREFRDWVIKNDFEVSYHESPGIHNWTFWNEYLEPAIVWALED